MHHLTDKMISTIVLLKRVGALTHHPKKKKKKKRERVGASVSFSFKGLEFTYHFNSNVSNFWQKITNIYIYIYFFWERRSNFYYLGRPVNLAWSTWRISSGISFIQTCIWDKESVLLAKEWATVYKSSELISL